MNLYGYVLNDPVNFVDPLGLSPGDCRDYEVWMYRIIYQVWSPGGVGPGKIVEKYPETRQVCDSPVTNGPSGPGDGGGDGEGQVILVTAQRPLRNCSRSAPNSSFNMEGRVTVGPLMGLGIVPIRYGVSQVRVVTYGPPPGAVSSDNLLQTILGLQGSVTLQFSNSNRIPVNILQQRDVFVTRSGPPRVTQLAVPLGTSQVFVIGTNTTPPRTIVTIYGC